MGRRDEFFLLDVCSEIQRTPALQAGCVMYLPRALASCSMPVRNHLGGEFVRRNGVYTLTIMSPSDIGLPYGTYPRLLIIHLATQAKLSGERDVYLDESLTKFLARLGKRCSGGKNGTVHALKSQAQRLFASTILWQSSSASSWTIDAMRIATSASIFWQPQNAVEWGCRIRLDEAFFQDVIACAVPIDARALRAFSAAPLCMDIYGWLTYRYFGLRRPTLIRWEQLHAQFGSACERVGHFKQQFVSSIAKVAILYPEARFEIRRNGLLMLPSPPHVSPARGSRSHGV